MQHWQWLMAVLCVRNLNNTKKDKKMKCVASHLFLGTGQLFCPITAHGAPAPWTNRFRAHFTTAESDGEGPVCILSGLWWSHWMWEVSGMRSVSWSSEKKRADKEDPSSLEVHNTSLLWLLWSQGHKVVDVLRIIQITVTHIEQDNEA